MTINKKISLADFQDAGKKSATATTTTTKNPALKAIKWTEHEKTKHVLKTDCVYIYIRKLPLKNGAVSNHVKIGLGHKLADLCKFDLKSKVKVYSAPNNPYWIRLAKSTDGYGYSINTSKQFHTLRHIGVVMNHLDLRETDKNIELPFDFLEDDSLVIDFEKVKALTPSIKTSTTASPDTNTTYFRGFESAKITHS